MRLNQFLARAGFGSRRACEQLVRDGAVTINGHRLTELATRVAPGDNVLVHHKPVKMPVTLVAVLHKPAGYLCTAPDSTHDRTIFELLPKGWPRVVYVGRLDKDSEGLLVVTNDGILAQRLTRPEGKVRKTYIVTLDREFDFAHAPRLTRGFPIEEGFARMEEIFRIGPKAVKVVLTQGLKRQIREMFYRLGYEVRRLVRVQIGGLTIDALPVGEVRILTRDEVARFFPLSAKGTLPPRPPRPASRKAVNARPAETVATSDSPPPKPRRAYTPPRRRPTGPNGRKPTVRAASRRNP